MLEPSERLGARETGGMSVLRQHEFFQGTVWEKMDQQQAPELMPYLPATDRNPELWSSQTKVSTKSYWFLDMKLIFQKKKKKKKRQSEASSSNTLYLVFFFQ